MRNQFRRGARSAGAAADERNISIQGWLEEAVDAKMIAENIGRFKKN